MTPVVDPGRGGSASSLTVFKPHLGQVICHICIGGAPLNEHDARLLLKTESCKVDAKASGSSGWCETGNSWQEYDSPNSAILQLLVPLPSPDSVVDLAARRNECNVG